jgi:hypothetical protein
MLVTRQSRVPAALLLTRPHSSSLFLTPCRVTAGDDETPLSLNGHSFQLKLGFMCMSKQSMQFGSAFTGDRGVTSSFMS